MRVGSAPSTFPRVLSTLSVTLAADAGMSPGSARSGEAIRRGIELAIDGINGRGGVLGPARGPVVQNDGDPSSGRALLHS